MSEETKKLMKPVGRGGNNFRPDVTMVQELLNQCPLVPLATLDVTGSCDYSTIYSIEEFQRRTVTMARPDGRVDPGGRTFDALVTVAAGKPYVPRSPPAAPDDNKKYTDNPNEVTTKRTTPSANDVVTLLRQAWPELTENGARTLTAQFMHETGGGKYCFNWNLGNVKAGASELHMYLHGVWEVDTPERAKGQVDKSNGLAHIATDEEIKQHGWSCPTGKSVAVFDPPHVQCRFRAYVSLQDGAQKWMGTHKSIAGKNPNYLADVNKGDCAAVAKDLKNAGYYTGGEADYARSMTSKKAEIDKSLGAAP